jgi:hypothetical protein
MQRQLWFILFLTVLLFHAYVEGGFILIYYTIWTFTLETIFFGLLMLKSPRIVAIRRHLFEIIFAPSIVVCVGFWIVIAPIYLRSSKPKNAVLVFVTHGLNAIAMITEIKTLKTFAIWKPLLYTLIYNLFLIVYVGAGGRSISGKLPYWYAEYDKAVGWVFFALAMSAVALVHVFSATYVWPVRPKRESIQYIV